MKNTPLLLACFLLLLSSQSSFAADHREHFERGVPADKNFFPIAVWDQDPVFAKMYRQAGFSVYLGLYGGPTEQQLKALKGSGMRVVCAQNAVGLAHKDDPIIIGWLQQPDEPDNAQPDGHGRFGPAVTPQKMIQQYDTLHENDPRRPVFVNFGQGVANDQWVGHGTGFNAASYPLYTRCADVLMFDCYPVANLINSSGKHVPNGQDFLWYIPRGIDRLRQWSNGTKTIWNHVECTRLNNPDAKATPAQVRAEVWMSLVHGSKGIVYYVHESAPKFSSHALLEDREMLRAVTEINQEVLSLAPALNSPAIRGAAIATSSQKDVPIDLSVHRYHDETYIFAVAMRNAKTTGTIRLVAPAGQSVEEIGTRRELKLRHGEFEDDFDAYGVHLYRIH